MKLTVGMACHNDFQGTWFTIESLLMYHAGALAGNEIVVVDNDPESVEGKMVADLCRNWLPKHVRYIPAPEVQGTSAPRQRVFDEACGEIVLCMDSHVLLVPDSLRKLIDFADANPESLDLWQSPMLYDNQESISTHFDPVWRSEMLGTWGTDERANDPNAEPFEIPAQGLGLFACRKKAWLGFNPALRGFGGEEVCLHEKFIQAGRRTLCLPFLRWLHRFGRPNGVKYRLTLWDKARNYYIWHKELGWDVSPIHEHFVTNGHLPESEWQAIVDGRNLMQEMHGIGDGAAWKAPAPVPALASPDEFAKFEGNKVEDAGCKTCGGAKQITGTLEEAFQRAATTKSDINEHAPALKALAAQCEHVTEFGHRPAVSTVALLAGQPKRFVTYSDTVSAEANSLGGVAEPTSYEPRVGSSLTADIEETDLLFIDTKHTAPHLNAELERHAPKVRKWIALHDTVVFGERGEDGGPGLLPAMRKFVAEHPEWFVWSHVNNNHGFTVLSRREEDKPKLPPIITRAKNFAIAVAKHVADGGKKVTPEQLGERLDICSLCPQRVASINGSKEDACSVCGCPLLDEPRAKATWHSEVCPLGKWPMLDVIQPPTEVAK